MASHTAHLEAPKQANMHWLMSFILRHKQAAFLAIASGSIGGITLALEPYFVGVIVDNITRDGIVMAQITRDVLILLGITFVTVVMFFAQRHYSGEVAYRVHYDIRRIVFEHMVTLDNDFYRQHPTGDLISRMFSDLNWVWRLLALMFNRGGNAVTALMMSIILLGVIDWQLTLMVLTILAIATVIQLRVGLLLVPISEKVQDQAGVVSALVQDSISGIQTVKTFGREADLAAAFRQENEAYRRQWLAFKRRNEPVGMLPQLITYVTTGLVVIFWRNKGRQWRHYNWELHTISTLFDTDSARFADDWNNIPTLFSDTRRDAAYFALVTSA
ncbi:MAG: ABC transporter transmembrane domain-containing protein [Anaerolineae bacterium]|nr:ABC transporter transmembrane domain-containing protein [Anaerolineae bacterium]